MQPAPFSLPSRYCGVVVLFGFDDVEPEVVPFVSVLVFLWCFLCFLEVVPGSVLVPEVADWPDWSELAVPVLLLAAPALPAWPDVPLV